MPDRGWALQRPRSALYGTVPPFDPCARDGDEAPAHRGGRALPGGACRALFRAGCVPPPLNIRMSQKGSLGRWHPGATEGNRALPGGTACLVPGGVLRSGVRFATILLKNSDFSENR